jgi:hypothetical protein
MSAASSSPSRRHGLVAAVAIGLVVLASAWLRAPGFSQGGFASHDVAGILYNAMLLHDGGLPYVDSIELKAPGTFWLAKWLAGPAGTDIARFQIWANLFGLASLVAIATIAWRMFGARAAVVAATLYALHDAHLDSMDANYVTWAQLPAILGVGWALAAVRAPGRAAARVGWLVAGVLCGLAVIAKQPAGAALLSVLAMALLQGQAAGRRGVAVLFVLGGAALAHAPLVLRYALAGELPALLSGYLLPPLAMRYVASGGQSDGTPAIVEGAWATVHFLVLPLSLAVTALRPPEDEASRRHALALLVWAVAALVAASVGLRFYKGYFLGLLPPLCLLAAAPWSLTGAARPLRPLARAVLLAPIALLVARQVLVLEKHRADRARPHDEGGRVIARHVTAHTDAGDRIWVWGWHLWDVYPLTGLKSGSRIYKSLGLLTPPNDDTWRLPASPLRFVDGPWAHMLVEDLQENRPVWIVLGSTVPRGEFRALQDLLRREYVQDRSIRLSRVQFWWRKDRAAAARQAGRASSSSGS